MRNINAGDVVLIEKPLTLTFRAYHPTATRYLEVGDSITALYVGHYLSKDSSDAIYSFKKMIVYESIHGYGVNYYSNDTNASVFLAGNYGIAFYDDIVSKYDSSINIDNIISLSNSNGYAYIRSS